MLGLGPTFSLILTLENMNTEKALAGLSVLFHCKPTIYKLSTYVVVIPLIPPGLSYKIVTKVQECMLEDPSLKMETTVPTVQMIRVFVVRKNQAQPVLAATINMPPTDLSVPIL